MCSPVAYMFFCVCVFDCCLSCCFLFGFEGVFVVCCLFRFVFFCLLLFFLSEDFPRPSERRKKMLAGQDFGKFRCRRKVRVMCVFVVACAFCMLSCCVVLRFVLCSCLLFVLLKCSLVVAIVWFVLCFFPIVFVAIVVFCVCLLFVSFWGCLCVLSCCVVLRVVVICFVFLFVVWFVHVCFALFVFVAWFALCFFFVKMVVVVGL